MSYDSETNPSSNDFTQNRAASGGGGNTGFGSTDPSQSQSQYGSSGMTSDSYGSTAARQDQFRTTDTDNFESRGPGLGAGRTAAGDNWDSGMNQASSGGNWDPNNNNQASSGGNWDSSNQGGGGNWNQSAQAGGKPSMGDKIRGGAETLAGKAMKNQDFMEKGQERKAGEF